MTNSPLKLWAPKHHSTSSSSARLEPRLCHAEVNIGDRWPRWQQCERTPKADAPYSDGKSYPTCGVHIGVVTRSLKTQEARDAKAQEDVSHLAHAQDGVRWLKERYGVEADIEYNAFGRAYTGRIIVEPDELHRVFESPSR